MTPSCKHASTHTHKCTDARKSARTPARTHHANMHARKAACKQASAHIQDFAEETATNHCRPLSLLHPPDPMLSVSTHSTPEVLAGPPSTSAGHPPASASACGRCRPTLRSPRWAFCTCLCPGDDTTYCKPANNNAWKELRRVVGELRDDAAVAVWLTGAPARPFEACKGD